MSKPVKELVAKSLSARFEGLTSLAVCGYQGLDAEDTRIMRGRLCEKDIHFTVIKNSCARRAFKENGLDLAVPLLDGPCALAWGSDSVVSVVRELIDISKEAEGLTIKAALMEGDVFSGDGQIDQLSKYPTRDEAIGQVVQCALSGGANLASAITGPGGQIGGILKTIEEKDN